MKPNRRLIIPVVALAMLILLVVALRPSPLPVNTATVMEGRFADTVNEEGQTRLRDTYTVSAPIGGYLQRVEAEPGDRIELGQVLFRLEPHPAPALDARSLSQARENLSASRARHQNAMANLETAEADARFAESEFQRYRELHERGLVSTTEMERARSSRDRSAAARRAATHTVEVAGFEVESARAVLDIASGERPASDQPELEVRSPVGGTVLRRHRCCEGAISAGEPVLDVGTLTDLEVQVNLLSTAAVRVRPGMRVIMTGWGGDDELTGTVRRVEPAGFTRVSALGVDEQRVPVVIDFDDPASAWDRLGVAYRIEAEFIVWEASNVIQVPTSALFRLDGEWNVYLIEEGRARLRSVERGRASGLSSQIISGLEPGEVIITHPGDRIADGTRVRAD